MARRKRSTIGWIFLLGVIALAGFGVYRLASETLVGRKVADAAGAGLKAGLKAGVKAGGQAFKKTSLPE